MAKKKKCWRKTRNDDFAKVWLSKDGKKGVSAQESPEPFNRKWVTFAGDVKNAKIIQKDTTKSTAIKKAESYMKKHNVC